MAITIEEAETTTGAIDYAGIGRAEKRKMNLVKSERVLPDEYLGKCKVAKALGVDVLSNKFSEKVPQRYRTLDAIADRLIAAGYTSRENAWNAALQVTSEQLPRTQWTRDWDSYVLSYKAR